MDKLTQECEESYQKMYSEKNRVLNEIYSCIQKAGLSTGEALDLLKDLEVAIRYGSNLVPAQFRYSKMFAGETGRIKVLSKGQ